MIKKLCRFSGCNNYAIDGKAYCEEHYVAPKPFATATRCNEGMYATARWRNLRKAHLAMYPVCAVCGATDDLSVDHIVAPCGNEDLFYNPDNLQTLCRNCHRKKTAQEIRQRRG